MHCQGIISARVSDKAIGLKRTCHRRMLRATCQAEQGRSVKVNASVPQSDVAPTPDFKAQDLIPPTTAKGVCPFRRVLSPLPPKSPLQAFLDKFNAITALLSTDFLDPRATQHKILSKQPIAEGAVFGSIVTVVGNGEVAKSALANEADFAPTEEFLKELLGEQTVLALAGEQHNKLRGLLAPFFAADEIEKYTPRVQKLATKYLESLVEQSGAASEGPKVHPLMESFTLEVISRFVAGLTVTDAELDELKSDFKTMVFGIAVSPVSLDVPWLPYGQGMAAKRRILARIDQWLAASRQRLAAGAEPIGVLDELVGYVDAQGQRLTDDQLRDNMITFLFAGYDTTASTITASMYYLHAHPQFVHPLREEQRQVVRKFGPEITSQCLRSMKVADRYIKEVMRLSPVVPGLSRTAKHDMQSADLVIRKGGVVDLALLHIAENDPFWAGRDGDLAPDVFNPDRWLLPGALTNGQHIPFGYGKHICLGMSLALMEVKTMLAVLVREYEVEGAVYPERWIYMPLLQPSNGLPVRLARHVSTSD